MKCDPHDTNLVMTVGANTPQNLLNNCDQIVFEEFEFASFSRNLSTFILTSKSF